MSRFFIYHPRSDEREEIDYYTFISIIKGTSIMSLGDSDEFTEFWLSENLLLHIESVENSPYVSILSTLNPDEIAPIRIQLFAEEEEPSAAEVEQRLHSLRQMYAIVFLLNEGREGELAKMIARNPDSDLEELLDKNERLYLQAAVKGSYFVTLLTKIKGSSQKALNLLSCLSSEGRALLMRRVRADTVKIESLASQEKVKLAKMRADAVIDTINKIEEIKNPKDRAAIKAMFWKNAELVDQDNLAISPPPDIPRKVPRRKR